ncbi:MAG TPA: tRNA lysidine(34) synthetase TilS [Candidatus Acidoferrales bacterium]|nr:tRNA lysidine(34) synthetase TilS [Candidatus Acidoferrales bacterium]
MPRALTDRIQQTIKKHGMLRAGDRVAVAVSGGADSVALLRLFHSMRDELGIILVVVHFNHQLRGSESDGDEKFVVSLAETLALPVIIGRADVALAAKCNGWNLEDAARRLRYQFFEEASEQHAIARVATAHTADDQAETVLARIIRGTGLAGLSAIHPVRAKVIRPLLEIRREELREYLNSIHQNWREDSSNTDKSRLRARLRSDLLPQLEHFSPNIVTNLNTLSALACDEELFWVSLVENRCTEIVTAEDGVQSVSAAHLLSPLDGLPNQNGDSRYPQQALTQRIIRRLYADAAEEGGELSHQHVDRIIQMARSGSSGQLLHLPGGVQVRKEYGQLMFLHSGEKNPSKQRTNRAARYCYPIDLCGQASATFSVPQLGRTFRLKVIDWHMQARETITEGVVLDTEQLRPPLVLRSCKPGDAYRPLGRRHQRKLSRMLMAKRIGRSERVLWPVLASADSIAWADAMPLAADFCATGSTRRALWICGRAE